MKILFTAKGKEWGSDLDPRFGRASGFLLYDTTTEETKWFENENVNASHGAGTNAAQKAAQLKTEVLITGHVGPKAKSALEAAGIKIFTVDKEPCKLKEALEIYNS
jgi:predicted Fe-Mo cluster-binding NifX family protein